MSIEENQEIINLEIIYHPETGSIYIENEYAETTNPETTIEERLFTADRIYDIIVLFVTILVVSFLVILFNIFYEDSCRIFKTMCPKNKNETIVIAPTKTYIIRK